MKESELRERILRMIAAGATFEERELDCFEPVPDRDPLTYESRRKELVRSGAGGDETRFRTQLQRRALPEERLRRQLSDVTVVEPKNLPPWAQFLLNSLQKQKMKSGESSSEYGFFTTVAAEWLQSKPPELRLSARAKQAVFESLAQRLQMACGPLFAREIQLASRLSDISGWMTLFEEYPALARLTSVCYLNWRDSIATMFRRFTSDLNLLRTELFGGKPLGLLEDFVGNAGDPHRHGHSAAILHFENGSVVYKPKDLRIAAWFMELTRFLNTSGLRIPLHVRKILVRPGYAWEEFVEPSACASPVAVDRFYCRMGMLLRLLQLIGGRDFSVENIRAAGEYPVAVDLEMLFVQEHKPPPDRNPAFHEASLRIDESVLPVGVLSFTNPLGAGKRCWDLSALARENPVTGEQKHLPHLGENPVSPIDHFESIVNGYLEMNTVLQAQASGLEEFSRQTAEMPVRYLQRGTWAYALLMQTITSPASLRDGIQFRIALERCRRTTRPVVPEIIQDEIDSLLEFDVPFFHSFPGRDSVLLSGGIEIPGYFAEPALERVVQGIRRLDRFDAREAVDVIRSAFSTMYEIPSDSMATVHPLSTALPDFRTRAVEIGDFILHHAIESNGRLAWIGLAHHPQYDLHRMEPLPPDILSGTAGLAIVFSDLYRVSGEERFKSAAEVILQSIAVAVGSLPESLAFLESRQQAGESPEFYCGFHYGIGSQVYALLRCGFQEQKSPNNIPDLPISVLMKAAPGDVISGSAGFLASLLPGAKRFKAAGQELIQGLLRSRREDGRFPEPPYPEGSHFLDCLSPTQSGIAYSLLCAATELDVAMPVDSLLELFRFDDGEQETSGRLLVNLAALKFSSQYEGTVLARLDRWIEAHADSGASGQLLDLFEVTESAFQVTGTRGYRDAATEAASRILALRNQSGKWFPESFASDRHRLSAVTGLGAVAHAFARLVDPGIRSIRLPM